MKLFINPALFGLVSGTINDWEWAGFGRKRCETQHNHMNHDDVPGFPGSLCNWIFIILWTNRNHRAPAWPVWTCVRASSHVTTSENSYRSALHQTTSTRFHTENSPWFSKSGQNDQISEWLIHKTDPLTVLWRFLNIWDIFKPDSSRQQRESSQKMDRQADR